MAFQARDSRTATGTRRHANADVPTWRWLSLFAVIGTIVHHEVQGWLGHATLEDQLTRSGSALVPVHPAFAAWIIILAGLLVVALYQHAASQRTVAVFDRVSRHVVLACGLAVVASLALSIAITALAACALALVAGAAYARIHRELAVPTSPRRAAGWIAIPFALLLGFAVAVAIAAVDATFVAAGCPSVVPAIALVLGAAVIIAQLGVRHRDPALPAFFAWLLIGILAANRDTAVAATALLAGGLCAASAIFIAMTRANRQPDELRAR